MGGGGGSFTAIIVIIIRDYRESRAVNQSVAGSQIKIIKFEMDCHHFGCLLFWFERNIVTGGRVPGRGSFKPGQAAHTGIISNRSITLQFIWVIILSPRPRD